MINKKENNILYKTQGDANNSADSQLISQDKILGKVFHHLPYLGKLTVFLKTLSGFLLLIVLPAFVFIIYEIMNIKNELTKEIDKKLIQKHTHPQGVQVHYSPHPQGV